MHNLQDSVFIWASGWLNFDICFSVPLSVCLLNSPLKQRKEMFTQWNLKGALMLIWKSTNIFVFIRKQNVEDFTWKHLLLFEKCAREISGKFVYKHSETIEYVKN